MIDFEARVQCAKKRHQCFACERDIAPGQIYVVYPTSDNAGKMQSLKMDIECSFLMTQKTGENARKITKGEFTDIRIPNRLRKLRNKYRRNPKSAIEEAGLDKLKPKAASVVKPAGTVIVKSEMIDPGRKLVFFPKRKYTPEQFAPGTPICLRGGVGGAIRHGVVKLARIVDGARHGYENQECIGLHVL